MKKKNYWLLLNVLLFVACNGSEDVVNLEKTNSSVIYSLQLDEEILPFPISSKSMPLLDVSEPTLRGDEGVKEVEDLCSSIEYYVYEEGKDTPIRKESYVVNEMNNGVLKDSLPAGKYDVIFIAHNSTVLSCTDGAMSFDKIADTFYIAFSMDIEVGENRREEVVLSRIVSKIEFVAKDAVPVDLKTFAMQADRIPDKLDVKTGFGIVSEESSSIFSHEFQSEEIGIDHFSHAFYTLVPKNAGTLDVTIVATNTSDVVSRQRTITDVTPIANRIIRYTGRLYTFSPSDNEFTFVIEDDGVWDDPVENELQE